MNRPNAAKRLIGQTFGRLSVLKLGLSKFSVVCLCVCGQEFETSAYRVEAGETQSCGCLHKERTSQANRKRAKFDSAVNLVKHHAIIRGWEWDLTSEQATVLLQGDCYYCGCPPCAKTRSGRYMRNGIDRVDSGIGYISSNCVSCCRTCNIAKSNLSLARFKELIANIYDNLKLGEK